MEKKYDTIVKEIKEDLQKMSNSDIDIQEAIDLFEKNMKKINDLKQRLEGYQLTVKKVMDDNKIEAFEA